MKSKADIVRNTIVATAARFGLILIAALSLAGTSYADTVLTCKEAWGSSDSCGGCTGMTWENAAPTLKVKTTANDFWTLLSNLKPTDSVSTSTQSPGTAATCAQVTGKRAVAELLGSTPAVPVPPVTPFPTSGPGQFTVTWPPVLKGTLGEDVSKDITGYCIYYGLTVGSMATKYCVGNVTMATVTNLPAGFYYLQMTAVVGIVESDKTSAGSVNVMGTPTTPPIPVPIAVVFTPGTWSAKKSSTNLKTGLATHNDCMAYLVTQPAGKYSCAFSGETVTVTVK